jgi:hypothetical protein
MQAVKRRVSTGLVLIVALVALVALVGSNAAMAGTTGKHKGAKIVAKHVSKQAAGKRARLVALKTSSAKGETPSSETSGETGGAAESAADTAAQDAACKAAGIDPNGNVQFDDQTNTCSLDTGGNDTGGTTG